MHILSESMRALAGGRNNVSPVTMGTSKSFAFTSERGHRNIWMFSLTETNLVEAVAAST
jgi:hypothetical protein